MKIFYQNVNGLCTKTDEFYENVERKNYDVILLTETKLHDGITKSETFSSQYTVYRRDREDREGGGVLIAIKSDRNFQKRKWNTAECEDLWISVRYRNYNIHICCVYLIPQCPYDDFYMFIENVEKRMTNNENDRFLIVGDFNMPNLTSSKKSARDGSKLKTLQDFIKDFEMRQCNRGRNDNYRTLDLVLCNATISVTKTRGMVAEDVHHPAVEIKL